MRDVKKEKRKKKISAAVRKMSLASDSQHGCMQMLLAMIGCIQKLVNLENLLILVSSKGHTYYDAALSFWNAGRHVSLIAHPNSMTLCWMKKNQIFKKQKTKTKTKTWWLNIA